MTLDPVFLSRVQFGFTIAFHYLFPPLTIGLGVLLVIMEALYLRTRDLQYEAMAKFWTRIFGLIFAIGVATGIVMEFQFGTNWSTYSRYVGDIFGAALAAEGIFAFFLESGFLAVLIFGWDRVSARMHFFATLMVSFGSIFSAVWIVIANSWQQTPAGFRVIEQVQADGSAIAVAELTDFWAALLNPSTLVRISHVLIGAMIAGAFLVLSVCSYYLLQGRHQDFARRGIRIALPFALVFAVLAALTGDWHARNVAQHQPPKLAAMEGLYRTQAHAPLHIAGFPDDATQEVRASIAIPGMLSFLVHHDAARPVTGLDAFPKTDWPPVPATFQFFHLMVGVGVLMLAITAVGVALLPRGRLFGQHWLLWILVPAVILPQISNQAGWFTAEVGRQPWIVYPSYERNASGGYTPVGGLRTAEAHSPSVDGGEVLTSIILVALIYGMLFALWLYVLDKKIKAGPESPEQLAAAARARGQGWVPTAAERAGEGGASLTDVNPDAKPSR